MQCGLRKRNIEAGGVIDNEEEQYLIVFAEKYQDTSTKAERTRKRYATTIQYIKVSAEENANRLIDHPYFSGKIKTPEL
jgi:hypothetical protein